MVKNWVMTKNMGQKLGNNTYIPPRTLCVEDASLQHLDQETFYSYTSCMDT
jgi:hypothetical protein